ncbi:MAG: hypothetical protein AAGF12_37950 [Myxococcota bacterium]
MGACLIADAGGLLEVEARIGAEVDLERELLASIVGHDSAPSLIEFLLKQRCFGLTRRVLAVLEPELRQKPWCIAAGGVAAHGVGDPKAVKAARSALKRWGGSSAGFEARLRATAILSPEEQELQSAMIHLTDEEVRRAIDLAFGKATIPLTETELTTGGIDGPYVVKHYFKKTRADVESNFAPGLHMEDFMYMTPKAIEYYLPSPLRLMLDDPTDADLWIYVRGFLKFSSDPWGRFSFLSAVQCEAIARWAEYLEREFPRTRSDIKPREAAQIKEIYGARTVELRRSEIE